MRLVSDIGLINVFFFESYEKSVSVALHPRLHERHHMDEARKRSGKVGLVKF